MKPLIGSILGEGIDFVSQFKDISLSWGSGHGSGWPCGGRSVQQLLSLISGLWGEKWEFLCATPFLSSFSFSLEHQLMR